jgi:DNA-binding response OmpR family regulator
MRVLVVEDESRMAGLLRRALREEGYAVNVAGDGPEGLWLATENEYGAIVLDVMLPPAWMDSGCADGCGSRESGSRC